MRLSWDELTHIEQDIARRTFEDGLEQERIRYGSADLIRELHTLREALNQLSRDAERMLITETELASNYEWHPPGASALASLRARLTDQLSWLEIPEKGRPSQIARQDAIAELRKFWISRGGDPAKGKLQTDNADREPFRPNAFTQFLGECLMRLDHETNNFEVACRRAHSALRALGR